MKKIALLFVFMFTLIFAFGQKSEVSQIVINNTRTADTTYFISLKGNYPWRLYVEWSANDGTTTSIIPVTKTTLAGSASNYSGISAVTVTGATGFQAFSDPDGQMDSYLGLFVDVQAGKTITLNVWLYVIPK